MKKRYFIVCPQYEDDSEYGLFKVCSTYSKDPFIVIYNMDDFEEVRNFNNRTKAIKFVKSKGYKRVFTI